MKTPLLTTLFLLLSAALLAQPGDPFTPINKQGFIQPFLQCVVDEAHFANYAAEAH
jgi:hypothetical protein